TFFTLIFPPQLISQQPFVVVSTNPADGATAVDPNLTFEITFSAPLDTTARFDYPNGFYINLILDPDSLIGEPDAIYLDPTMTTVYVENLSLAPNTKYMLMIVNAVSMNNDSLAMPYGVTFTTGSELPDGKVSGTVNGADIDPIGTIVVMMTQPIFNDKEMGAEAAAVVTSSAGDYTVNYVPPGTYWPMALKNIYIDSEGSMTPLENSAVGFYDPDANNKQDSIVVAAGASLTDIDFHIVTLKSTTARFGMDAVMDSANNWSADAELIQLRGMDLNENGNALVWQYVFYSPALEEYRSWVTVGFIIMPLEIEDEIEESIPLPENWIDSDVAADTAEFYGGKAFREQHPQINITAFLGYSIPFGDDDCDDMILKNKFGNLQSVNGLQFSLNALFKTKSNFMNPIWFFMYSAGDDETGEYQQIFFLIDAVTGEIYDKTTARVAETEASGVAKIWANDAILVAAFCPSFVMDGIAEFGKASFWQFNYYSPGIDSIIGVVTVNGITLGLISSDDFSNMDVTPLPENWIDSDAASLAAELNGGTEYRYSQSDVSVGAALAIGQIFFGFDNAVWAFSYFSTTADPLYIYIDALTGEYVNLGPLTAKESEVAAADSSLSWAADATLVMVAGGMDGSLEKDGRANTWVFIYYSAALNIFNQFVTTYGQVVHSWTYFDNNPYAQQPLPENWLNSDSAAVIAEKSGGADFRHSQFSPEIFASLRRGEYFIDMSRPVWHFAYRTETDSLHLFFDCVTGQILTKVEMINSNEQLPKDFELTQNYPNPFNPETTVSFSLPRSCHVLIDIYSILGEKVATVVNEKKEAGKYQVKWNGRDKFDRMVPSGIYLYKIEAGSYSKIMKMTLIH
ncbi:Ig-like domain-containing protein, partial [candidate division KSB1 bacterium]|nr:Ig-like domain-containing protein [candidate division KSB1 bacterium]